MRIALPARSIRDSLNAIPAPPGRWWIGCLAAILVLAATLAPVQAASDAIDVASARDLILPASQIPADMVARLDQSMPITDKTLAPVIGSMMLRTFHQNGWISGYHGWLDSRSSVGAPFVVYDLYGFKTSQGAMIGRLAYQNQMLGVQASIQNDALPKSALVWTDTGTFGNGQPYTVAEILFRVSNVVGDVTGFYVGSDSQAAASALQQATEVTIACAHWLSTRLPHPRHAALPLLPLALLPPALQRLRRR